MFVTVCIDVTIQKEWKILILRSFSKVLELESCVVQYQKFHLKKKILCYSCAHEYCLSTIFRHLKKTTSLSKNIRILGNSVVFFYFLLFDFILIFQSKTIKYWHHVKPQNKPMKNTLPSNTMNTFSVLVWKLLKISFCLVFYYGEDFFLPSCFC